VTHQFSDLVSAATSHTVTVRAPDGHPLMRAKLMQAAAVAAAGVVLAPRLTAAATLGALLKGFSLSLEEASEQPLTP
jgi:hypothetical protein